LDQREGRAECEDKGGDMSVIIHTGKAGSSIPIRKFAKRNPKHRLHPKPAQIRFYTTTPVSTKHQMLIHAGRKIDTENLENDIALIQEHFGTSRSLSGRLAIRLTAQAIRANKALPEVR